MMKPQIDAINGQTWLICGGRDFANKEMFADAMSELVRKRGMPIRIINGGALGADWMAMEWAQHHAIEFIIVAAEWGIYGRAAGHLRNQAMLDKYHPDLVVAFPGGKGTADMVRRSRAVGAKVKEIGVMP